MSIQFANETTLSLTEIAAVVPRRRRRRKTAVSTIYRWVTHGVHGVRLESLQVGGTRCSSVEALQRFFVALSSQQQSVRTDAHPEIETRLASANRELEGIWGRQPRRSPR